MSVSLPIAGAVRGRAAQSNHSGRFEPRSREDFDDGWTERETLPRLDDTLTALTSRTIVSHNTSPDVGFDQSINPYVGCSHGCIYCYARPAHAYMGLSPGLDFETKLFFKPDAAALLERELSKPGYVAKTIHIGGYIGRDGVAGPGQDVSLDHHPGPQAGPGHGAPRGDAYAPARRRSRFDRRRRAHRRAVRAGHRRAERS
jgi:hypothetical protein